MENLDETMNVPPQSEIVIYQSEDGNAAGRAGGYGMQRCVIVGGAEIRDYGNARGMLRGDDFIIYCDCGLRHLEGLGAAPSLVVGDFDTFKGPRPEAETITLPIEKDDTDTVYAAKEGLRRGFKDFLLLGAVGGRMDHTLANLSILVMLFENGAKGRIADDFSVMEMVGREPVEIDGTCRFFSLLNITGTAKDISIEGAKFPLSGGEITCSYQYGVSNEVLPGQKARVSVGEGLLLLVRVFK